MSQNGTNTAKTNGAPAAAAGRMDVTMADLVERIKKDEVRVRQAKQAAADEDDEKERYWEGYGVGLQKAQELIHEFEIVKKWMR